MFRVYTGKITLYYLSHQNKIIYQFIYETIYICKLLTQFSIQDDAGVETSSFDDRSASVIRLNNSTVLYLKVGIHIQSNVNEVGTYFLYINQN